MDDKRVGVLGGGQLGRMMAESCHRLGVKLCALDPMGNKSPTGEVTELCIEGSFQDPEKVQQLAALSDVITIEIEHVNVDALQALERDKHTVCPNSNTIRIIQDKYLQKVHLRSFDVPLPEFMETPTMTAAINAGKAFGYPFMLKNKRMAYDGKGNAVVESEADLPAAFEKLGAKTEIYDVYAEKWAPFTKELAVMIVRTKNDVVSYPVVETIQENSICAVVIAPAQISSSSLTEAKEIASQAVASFDGVGIYGVELFLLPNGKILLNEIAPRPHNSGHYTMEACDVDQFEMHIRAVLGLPCPIPTMITPCAVMVNILGEETMEETMRVLKRAMSVPGCGIHWYGKKEARKGRKMAHLTLTAPDLVTLSSRFEQLGTKLTREIFGLDTGTNAIPSTISVISGKRVITSDSTVGNVRTPVIGIVMGSDSDLPTMKEAAAVLDEFGVSYELTIVSAHRTPTRMYAYAQSAVERGLKLIIAGAGGAAHLPGMIAALTPLPVIGVPVKTSTLSGVDSLYSICQMPKGIPVATVAIGNASNAGLLAVRILGANGNNSDYVGKGLLDKMENYMINQEETVLKKADKLENIGYEQYLDGM